MNDRRIYIEHQVSGAAITMEAWWHHDGAGHSYCLASLDSEYRNNNDVGVGAATHRNAGNQALTYRGSFQIVVERRRIQET